MDLRAILQELKPAVPRAWGGSYIEEHLKRGTTPEVQWLFHMALAGNRVETARRLLEAGADPNGRDAEGKFAWEHVREAEPAALLLERGVPPGSCREDRQWSWLHWAVFHQKPRYVRLLLEHGAGVAVRNLQEETPLMIAARYCDVSIVRLLLESGADPNQGIERPHMPSTPLTIAAFEGSQEAVGVLLEAGADVRKYGTPALWCVCKDKTKQHLRILEMLLAAGADPNPGILDRAATRASPEMLRALVQAGARINDPGVYGTPLHAAACEGRLDNLQALLDLGADPALRLTEGEWEGLTPVEVARKYRKKKAVEILERAGAAPSVPQPDRSVAASWRRIEAWAEKRAPRLLASFGPPAGAAALAAAEAALGRSLPEDVRASYRLHDGQKVDLTLIPPGGEGDAGFSLLPLERVVSEWRIWKELLDGGDFEGESGAPSAGVRDHWWSPGWIPVTTNGCGDHHCVDLEPAEGGLSGQVITMFHAESARDRLAPSFADFLAELAETLTSGEWRLDSEGGIDGPQD